MIIDAAGSPARAGRAHGEQARDLIADGLERWRDELAETARTPTSSGRACRVSLGSATPPRAGHRTCWTRSKGSLRAPTPTPTPSSPPTASTRPGGGARRGRGCSAVAIADRGGKTVIGQNMDLDTWMDTTQVALRLRPDDGPQQVLLSRAGVVGLCGANAEGVGLVVNTLDQLPVAVDGLPVALVLRLLVAQTSLDDVEPLLRSIRHASGQAYTMASADAVVGFEAGGDFVASYANEPDRPGARWHTNHPLSDGDHDVTFDPDDWATGSSAPRLSRVDEAMADLATADDLVELLSDADAGICMYPGRWRDDGFTFGSLVIEIDEPPAVRIAPGPPDRTAWVDVPFV